MTGTRRLLVFATALATGLCTSPLHARQAPVGGVGDGTLVDARVEGLRADLDRVIRTSNTRGASWGVLVVSLDRGDTLFARSPHEALAPASNAKLLTTAAALHYLGPGFRFTTFLLSRGTVTDSILVGDLVLYGTGDPTISSRFGMRTSVWEAFADSLAARGIRVVQGDVVGDASFFEGPGTGEGWRDSYVDASYAAPASALSFSENIASLRITPAASAGMSPEVALLPGGDGIGIENAATTVAGSRSAIRAGRRAYGTPLEVMGRIGLTARPVYRSLPVSDPARFAAAAFREILAERGVSVEGMIRSNFDEVESLIQAGAAYTPAFERGARLQVIAVHQSPPLIEIVQVVNKESNNFMAEQLLRTFGRVAVGQGSAHAGAQAISRFLEDGIGANVFGASLRVVDGSGLSSLNRVSAATLVAVLDHMLDSPLGPDFWTSLPEAGGRDGLARMARTAAADNLRAKTGTIRNVSALSGYVRAANSERLAFSIISNDVPSTWRAKRVEDMIGTRLANFDRPLPVAVADPAPRSADAVVPATPGAALVGAPPDRPAPVPAAQSAGAAVRSEGQRDAVEYVVKRGDTLSSIADLHDTTVAALLAANPGIEPRRLMPGDMVLIR